LAQRPQGLQQLDPRLWVQPLVLLPLALELLHSHQSWAQEQLQLCSPLWLQLPELLLALPQELLLALPQAKVLLHVAAQSQLAQWLLELHLCHLLLTA